MDCGYVEHKKQELIKKSETYPKSADPKITPKGTLAHLIQVLLLRLLIIKTH